MSRRPRFSTLRPLVLAAVLVLALAGTGSTPASAGPPPLPAQAPAGPNAVVTWNDHAAAAARAACIAPFDNPLHESRMYAIMHVAVHDALNAVSRQSQPYAFKGRAPGASPEAAVAAAADVAARSPRRHHGTVRPVPRRGRRAGRGLLHRRAGGHPRRRSQAGGRRRRQAVELHDPGEACRRRLGHPAGRERLPAGRPARRVPVRRRRPAKRLRAPVGEVTPFVRRTDRIRVAPPYAGVARLRARPQPGETARRRRDDDPERAHRGADRGGPVLGRRTPPTSGTARPATSRSVTTWTCGRAPGCSAC